MSRKHVLRKNKVLVRYADEMYRSPLQVLITAELNAGYYVRTVASNTLYRCHRNTLYVCFKGGWVAILIACMLQWRFYVG